jgi:uncharacterized DUF497 family protein
VDHRLATELITYIIKSHYGDRNLDFRWNRWNEEHVGQHGVTPEEAEDVVVGARAPFPLVEKDERFLVWGPTTEGRLLQVVFVLDEDDSVFVIHTRDLTEQEKKRYRRKFR